MDWHADSLKDISDDVFARITDDIILGLCFEVHRAVKLNTLFTEDPSENEKKYEIHNETYSIFGEEYDSMKEAYIKCPHCEVFEISYMKFGNHLASCIGKGRSTKIKSVTNIRNISKVENDGSEDDDDDQIENGNSGDEWSSRSKRKPAKKKKNRKNPKPKTAPKGRTALKAKGKNGNFVLKTSSISAYYGMNNEQREMFLREVCGVVSEDNKNICLSPVQCTVHDDDQRKALRCSVLERNFQESPDDHINVEDDAIFDFGDNRNINGTSSSVKKKGRKRNA